MRALGNESDVASGIRFENKKYGDLQALHHPAAPGAPTVVLLHGYGADFEDLAPLASQLNAKAGMGWLFLNGPQKVEIAPGAYGRSWFPLSISDVHKGVDWSQSLPPGMKKAREAVEKALDAANVNIAQTVVGGFSQGSVLATDFVLHSRETPKGLVILSGTLVDANNWEKMALNKAGFHFFQSHGEYDPLLSFASAQALCGRLQKSGWKPTWVPFRGQHEIPLEVQSTLLVYLRKVLC